MKINWHKSLSLDNLRYMYSYVSSTIFLNYWMDENACNKNGRRVRLRLKVGF